MNYILVNQEFDYLNEAIKTNNPVVRKLVAKYVIDNFDSIMDDRLANYENNIDKYTASEFYQLQAQLFLFFHNLISHIFD